MSNKYTHRSGIVKIIFLAVGVIFVLRLSMLQLFDKEYKEKAKNQSLRNITQYPARGLMYDRNGNLLVYNEAVYDLMVIPRMVKDLDTAAFCRSVGITREEFLARMEKGAKERLWNEARGVYVCEKDGQASWMGQAWMVIGGLAPFLGEPSRLSTHHDSCGSCHVIVVIFVGVLQLGCEDIDLVGF